MGMFDFVKTAGRMLGITEDEPPAPDALKKELEQLGLKADDFQIVVDRDIGEGEVITGDAGVVTINRLIGDVDGDAEHLQGVRRDVLDMPSQG